MKDWTPPSRDEDLERADDLLDQADALLQRHRAQAGNEASPPARAQAPATFDDDLPLLTEIVDDSELPSTWPERRPFGAFATEGGAALAPVAEHPARTTAGTPLPDVSAPPMPPAPPPLAAEEMQADQDIAAAIDDPNERLADMDGEVARELTNRIATALGQIIDRELDTLRERLHAEMLAHLHATLLPELSARIGTVLEQAADPGRNPDRPPHG